MLSKAFSTPLRSLGSLTGLTIGGLYLDDTFRSGAIVNRTTRMVYAAAGTFYDYKFALTYGSDSPSAIHTRVAERWLWCVQKNGGLYTKLAQGVASMNHVLPPEYLKVLSVVQDRAPTVGWPEVEQVFREEFPNKAIVGTDPETSLFTTFEKEAMASASVAQVHRATLHDGTQVAVKVQKPDVKKQIEADLWAYEVMTAAIEYFFELPIVWMVPYTVNQLRKETNFMIELENGRRADRDADPAVRKNVHIPVAYDRHCTSRVLTCEWIDGVKITDEEGIKKLGLNHTDIMDIVTKFFSHQMFVAGFLHADPHPGNILIRRRLEASKTAKGLDALSVVVIDHGLYCDEPEEFRMSYATLWKAMVTQDDASLRKVAEQWGIVDHELFASMQLLKPYKGPQQSMGGRPATHGQVSRAEILELQQSAKHRIQGMLANSSRTPPELSLVGRHLNLVRSLNKALGSPVNRPRIMASYANRGLSRTFAPTNEKLTRYAKWKLWTRSKLEDLRFDSSLFLIEIAFRTAQTWRSIVQLWSGEDTGGFEELLERQVAGSVEAKFGFKIDADANGSVG